MHRRAGGARTYGMVAAAIACDVCREAHRWAGWTTRLPAVAVQLRPGFGDTRCYQGHRPMLPGTGGVPDAGSRQPGPGSSHSGTGGRRRGGQDAERRLAGKLAPATSGD